MMNVERHRLYQEKLARQRRCAIAAQTVVDPPSRSRFVTVRPFDASIDPLEPLRVRDGHFRTVPLADAHVIARSRFKAEADGVVIVSVADIIKSSASYYGVTPMDIMSARKNCVLPRHIAMYLSKALTLRSLPDIGRRFGGRDHTTILHAVRKIEGLKDEPEIAAAIEAVRSAVTHGEGR